MEILKNNYQYWKEKDKQESAEALESTVTEENCQSEQIKEENENS